MSRPLDGIGVLVTRPEHQAGGLCALIEEAGGEAWRFPALGIEPVSDTTSLQHDLTNLDRFDLAILVSPNAVDSVFDQLPGGWPTGLAAAVVGSGSARAFARRSGRPPDFTPSQRFDSEGLLELLPTRLDGKRVVILRGQEGRELLAESLTARGAVVERIATYRRVCPQPSAAALQRLLEPWQRGRIDIVTATSAETLRNLFAILEGDGQQLLNRTPLVVVSERMPAAAAELGYPLQPVVARRAADGAVVDAIIEWCTTRNER